MKYELKDRYPLFSTKNLPAYLVVLFLWLILSLIISWLVHVFINDSADRLTIFIVSAIAVMCGMMIMFGASAVNLRKLRSGFRRLAEGEKEVRIPPVWCPVLTMATRAALEMKETMEQENNKTSEGSWLS